MKGANEPLNTNNNAQYLHIVGIQTVATKKEAVKALNSGKGIPSLNVKRGDGPDIPTSNFHIENGKRIDSGTGVILGQLKPGEEKRKTEEQLKRARQIGDKKLEEKLTKVLVKMKEEEEFSL